MSNIKFSATDLAKFYVGSSTVDKMYLGSTEVFSNTPPITISGSSSGTWDNSANISAGSTTGSVTTNLTVSGGTGTYSYSWSLVSSADTSDSNGTANVVNNFTGSPTNGKNCTFSATVTNTAGTGNLPAQSSGNAVWRLTVTSGSQTKTFDFTANYLWQR